MTSEVTGYFGEDIQKIKMFIFVTSISTTEIPGYWTWVAKCLWEFFLSMLFYDRGPEGYAGLRKSLWGALLTFYYTWQVNSDVHRFGWNSRTHSEVLYRTTEG